MVGLQQSNNFPWSELFAIQFFPQDFVGHIDVFTETTRFTAGVACAHVGVGGDGKWMDG
tara:strand:- start:48 stop:224 length:177 start_codon:yes stop_codon:yes gene_type:complete